MLTALKCSGTSVTVGSLVAAITVRVIAGGAAVVCAAPEAGSAIAPSNSSPVVLNCMIASQVQRIIQAPYALPAPLGMAGRFELLLDGNREQRPSETEFVAVGVNEVEEALTPFGVLGRGSWLVSRCERTVVKCVDIGNVEDYPPPPGPAPLVRLGDEVEIARSCSKAGERRIFAAMQDLKPQRAVESDGSRHFVGAECNRADSLDHGQNSPVSFPRAVGSRHFS